MNVTVVDASAVAAVLFDEPEAEPVLASLDGPLLAPGLLVYEPASVCTTKLARRPADAQTILARYLLFGELEIELSEPHWQTLTRPRSLHPPGTPARSPTPQSGIPSRHRHPRPSNPPQHRSRALVALVVGRTAAWWPCAAERRGVGCTCCSGFERSRGQRLAHEYW